MPAAAAAPPPAASLTYAVSYAEYVGGGGYANGYLSALCTGAPGEAARRLTGLGGYHDPAGSADGARLAWLDAADRAPRIHLRELDGSVRAIVVGAHVADLAWSPDGRRIAYDKPDATGRFELWVVAADGGAAPQRVARDLSHPAWSPDGTTLAAVDLDGRVALVPAGGGTPRLVVPAVASAAAVAWSPDGSRLALVFAGRVSLVAPAGGTPTPLAQVGVSVGAPQLLDVAWSPDGSQLAFALAPFFGKSRGQSDVYVIPAAGGTPVNETSTPDLDETGISWHAAAPAGTAPPCFVAGGPGPEVLVGTPGDDLILGRGGADRIAGLGGNDYLHGGGGDDRIVGGPGRDVLRGGPGNDTLLARDGERDRASGNQGRDVAVVDRLDFVPRGGDPTEVVRRG